MKTVCKNTKELIILVSSFYFNNFKSYIQNKPILDNKDFILLDYYFKLNRIELNQLIIWFNNPILYLNYLSNLNAYSREFNYLNQIENNVFYKHYVNSNNKLNSVYFVIINEYFENCLKLNINKNLIVTSQKDFKNYKEGVLIKKEPYNSIYTINIFGFENGCFDAETKVLTDVNKQLSINIKTNKLPTLIELTNILNIYDVLYYQNKIIDNHLNIPYNNDFGLFNAIDVNKLELYLK
jgi:hypothetical protein